MSVVMFRNIYMYLLNKIKVANTIYVLYLVNFDFK